jgi:CheY-like chemotaxis protein
VDVLEAPDAEALERAREERPDLVLVPWRTRDAGALVNALGEDAMTRDAKVLLLVDDAASSREVAAAGADERLAAPFSPLQLQVKLRKLLGADVIGA